MPLNGKSLLANARQGYAEFLEKKARLIEPCGFSVPDSGINGMLFPFQRDIAHFNLEHGKSGTFAHTGLGKGPIQMEWCGS